MENSAVIMTSIGFILSTYACEYPQHCVGSECQYIKGRPTCLRGCNDGWSSSYCRDICIDRCVACDIQDARECTKCESGRYGIRCEDLCGKCNKGNCSINGTCHDGCTPGFWGTHCSNPCSQHCKDEGMDSPCEHHTGHCIYGCKDGYFGTCNQTCPQNCRHCNDSDAGCLTCGKEDGECLQGCREGYYGRHCQHTCPENCLQCNTTRDCDDCMVSRRGSNCTLLCHTCPSVRQYINCTVKCKDGIAGEMHDITTHKTSSKDNEDFFGTISGLINEKEYLLPFLASALVLCIGLSAIILWRCKKIRRERLSAMDNGCLEVKTTKEDVFQKCGDIYHEIHDEDLDTNMSLGPAGQRPLPDRPRLPIPLEAVTGAVDHAGSLPETGASGHSSFGYLTPEQTQDVEQPRYTSSRTDDGVYLDVRHSNNTECVVETSFTVTSEEVGKRHLVQGHPSVGTLNHVKMSATLRSDIRTRRCGTKHISWDSRTHLDICAVANDDPQTANKDKAGNRLFKVRPSVCKRAVINPRGSCGF